MNSDLKERYKEKLRTQLDEWNAQIRLITAKAEHRKADLKVKYSDELEELRIKQLQAHEKLKELESMSGEAWDHAKVTADKIWSDLRLSVANAKNKFRDYL